MTFYRSLQAINTKDDLSYWLVNLKTIDNIILVAAIDGKHSNLDFYTVLCIKKILYQP